MLDKRKEIKVLNDDMYLHCFVLLVCKQTKTFLII